VCLKTQVKRSYLCDKLINITTYCCISRMPWLSSRCRHLGCGSDRTRAVSYPEYLLILRSLKGTLRSDRAIADRILKGSVDKTAYSQLVGVGRLDPCSCTKCAN
jgi:hypothetical protein